MQILYMPVCSSVIFLFQAHRSFISGAAPMPINCWPMSPRYDEGPSSIWEFANYSSFALFSKTTSDSCQTVVELNTGLSG